jgi:fructose-1,6-bisphosphatase/inositol monophosphatase family enzyme
MSQSFDIEGGLEYSVELVAEAAEIAQKKFGRVAAESKADGTPVTEADWTIEELIRRRLHEHYPDHAVFGEETGASGPADSPFVWLIDPIDGTNNFAHGLPIWGVSLGLFKAGDPLLGVLSMPCLGQTFRAGRDLGAFCNDRRLSVATGDAITSNDLLVASAVGIPCWDYLAADPVKYRIVGSAAYAMALVAAGTAIGLVNDHWHLWDAGATLALLREAGAVTTDVNGASLYNIGGREMAAQCPCMITASPEYHRILMEYVMPAR